MDPLSFLLLLLLLCFPVSLVPAASNSFPFSSSKDAERNALLSTGVWNSFNYDDNSDYCNWDGLLCNTYGYVMEINLHGPDYCGSGCSLGYVNFSAFHHLAKITITDNGRLQGGIPPQISALSELTHLNLSRNYYLRGKLPLSLTNLTKLQMLDISLNSISGTIPPEIGNLTSLFALDLSGNLLHGSIPSTIGFLTRLRGLRLADNRCLRGPIPPEIGNLTSLTQLDLENNALNGTIPSRIEFLTQLETLNFRGNQIVSPIPFEIGNLTSLIDLDLGHNALNGCIPSTIGFLTRLETLNLRVNEFVGPIRVDIGFLHFLYSVDLGSNRINGTIPSNWNNVSSNLQYLYLDNNHLTGGVPLQIAMFNHIRMIDIGGNSISGTIASELELVPNAPSLTILLPYNALFGGIPGSLSNLRRVDLRNNNLCGPIPHSMQYIYNLGYLNGNLKLYYVPVSYERRHQNSSKTVKIFLPITLFFACLFSCGLCLYICLVQRKSNNSMIPKAKEGDIFKIWNYDGKIAYEDIIEATADFDLTYCIGTGGYGSVYRAQLPTGRVVAVKKLHRFEAENPTYDKCFRNEVEVLSGIRHRNIVKLFGY